MRSPDRPRGSLEYNYSSAALNSKDGQASASEFNLTLRHLSATNTVHHRHSHKTIFHPRSRHTASQFNDQSTSLRSLMKEGYGIKCCIQLPLFRTLLESRLYEGATRVAS
eukprot:6204206-Pleurochrysis_carterae.AAC.2